MKGFVTPRQRQILDRISHGMTLPEIATDMHLSYDTVRSHMALLLRRLGATGQAHAVALAFRAGELS